VITQDEAFMRAAELLSVALNGDDEDLTTRALTSGLAMMDLDRDACQQVALAVAVTSAGFVKAISERSGFPLALVWAEYTKEISGG
jgi:hypothetical protein